MTAQPSTLEGKVAIVTGGGGGIGRAVCRHMARLGARIVVNDLGVSVAGDSEAAKAADVVVEAIRAEGGEAVANTLSVTERASGRAMVEQAMDVFGRLDIVINNAGIIRMGAFDEAAESDWQGVLRTNLYGAVYLSHAAAQVFVRQRSGAFVHMSSAGGLSGSTGQTNYGAAKLGIVGLSQTLARDLGPLGIRSNCMVPSSTSRMTDLTDNARRHLMTPEALDNLRRARQASVPEHMAPVIAFLGSDAAAGLNGQIIGARGSELYLYGHPAPRRDLSSRNGWSPGWLADNLAAAWEPFLTPLEVITDVFRWAPAPGSAPSDS